MASAPRLLVVVDGSPLAGSSVHKLLLAACEGARAAGGEVALHHAYAMHIQPCIACGPNAAVPNYCIFHDAMDAVYAQLERAHAVTVGSPTQFATVRRQEERRA